MITWIIQVYHGKCLPAWHRISTILNGKNMQSLFFFILSLSPSNLTMTTVTITTKCIVVLHEFRTTFHWYYLHSKSTCDASTLMQKIKQNFLRIKIFGSHFIHYYGFALNQLSVITLLKRFFMDLFSNFFSSASVVRSEVRWWSFFFCFVICFIGTFVV